MQTNLNTALYCRLSREDDNIKDVSSSIASQTQLLTSFANKNNFGIYKTYIDDGYSGTNFNRPAFQEMLRDVENNRIKIILVKDLSRFGRNYLQTGKYLEEYFPIKRVRVIALNDNYDSKENDNDFTPFKNIINEWYAKDISKKVTSSLLLKQKKGEVPTGKQCLYGYMYDENRNRVINPETAPVVKYVIEATLKGTTKNEIIKTLRDNKVYVPGYYNYIRYNIHPQKYMNYPEEKKYLWKRNHIERIIYSNEYAGDLVVAKTKKYTFKMSNRYKNQEAMVIKKRFDPIITEDMEKKLLFLRDNRAVTRLPLEIDLFKGLIYCKCCGKKMSIKQYKRKNGVVLGYYCHNDDCRSKGLFKMETLKIVLEKELIFLNNIIRKRKEEILTNAKVYYTSLDKKVDTEKSSELNHKKKIENRVKEIKLLTKKLFEENVLGDIPKLAYESMMDDYDHELKELTDTLNKMCHSKDSYENNGKVKYLHLNNLINMLEKENICNLLDRNYLMNIFEKVFVFSNRKRVEIIYNYGIIDDFLSGIKEKVEDE